MLVLAYLGPLALIPLLTKKEDPDVQWHAKNGLAIFIAEVILAVGLGVLARVPYLGCLAVSVSCVIPLLFLVVFVLCVMKALAGQRFRIPVISDFADKM
jgi:uncharacterized membrane protein